MKKIRLLFQGDSITDAERNREDPGDLGPGYPKYAAQYLKEAYPDVEFEFINRGIGGNTTEDLVGRLQADFIDVKPDVVSILIGINDTWAHARDRSWIPDELFEQRYRTVLAAMKEIGAKIMVIEPFLAPIGDMPLMREDLDPKIGVIRKLALEYADAFMPTDGLFFSAYIGDDVRSFTVEGVHPTIPKGAEFIGRKYFEYIRPIIDELVAKPDAQ